MEIRAYDPGDLAACRELYAELVAHHRELYADPTIGGDDPGAAFDDYLATPERVATWVAANPAGIVGMTGLLWANGEATIEPLVITRARRREGIGRRLVEAAVAESRRRGATDVNIAPVARNEPAIRAFHALGFRTLGHVQLFIRLDAGDERWREGSDLHGLPFRF